MKQQNWLTQKRYKEIHVKIICVGNKIYKILVEADYIHLVLTSLEKGKNPLLPVICSRYLDDMSCQLYATIIDRVNI